MLSYVFKFKKMIESHKHRMIQKSNNSIRKLRKRKNGDVRKTTSETLNGRKEIKLFIWFHKIDQYIDIILDDSFEYEESKYCCRKKAVMERTRNIHIETGLILMQPEKYFLTYFDINLIARLKLS